MTDTSGLLALVEQDAAQAQSLQAQEGVASKKRRSGRASGAAAVQGDSSAHSQSDVQPGKKPKLSGKAADVAQATAASKSSKKKHRSAGSVAATAPIIVKKQRASAPAAAIVPPRVPKAPKLQEPLTAAQPDCTPTTAPMQAAATSPAGAPTHDAPLGFMRASQLPDATPPPSAAVCAVDHALMTLSSGDGSGHALDSLTYSPVTDRLTRDARGSDAAAPAPRASLCAANDAHLAPPPAPTQHASGAACEGRASAAAAALAAAAEAVVKAGRASGKASKGGAAALGKPPSGRASGKPPSGKASGKKSGKAKASGTAAPQGAAAQELITPAMPATFKVVIATAAAAPMPARRVAAYRPPAFVRGAPTRGVPHRATPTPTQPTPKPRPDSGGGYYEADYYDTPADDDPRDSIGGRSRDRGDRARHSGAGSGARRSSSGGGRDSGGRHSGGAGGSQAHKDAEEEEEAAPPTTVSALMQYRVPRVPGIRRPGNGFVPPRMVKK